MRVTSLGHAALYIETADQRILIDPVLEETLAGGALTFCPPRALDLGRLPEPTVLVVTHGHFDHFHPPSLDRFDKDLLVVTAEDPVLLERLAALGFRRVVALPPWRPIELGHTRLVPTPSGHDEAEFGIVVSEGGCAFWHMADAEVTPADGARVVREHGAVDVVSAKYQPVVGASMGYLRARGARFDKAEVIDWLETACAVDPKFVFPFASGLSFAGRHAWFNRYAFPFSAEEIARLLQRRLGADRAGVLLPGDVVEVTAGERPERKPQASPFVAMAPSARIGWEPVDVSTLAGLDDDAERRDLEARLDAFFAERLIPWLRRELGRSVSPWSLHRVDQIIWQLVVELGGGQRVERFLDYRAEPLEMCRGRHADANAFTHVSGRSLLDVLRARAPGLLFWLAGDARSYEKAIAVVDGRLFARPLPGPDQEPGDPLTYFLRHFGPTAEGKDTAVVWIHEPGDDATGPNEIEVLARQGETRAVVEKKALLSVLASREAERLGIAINDAEVEATSNQFRSRFGLQDSEQTFAWLREIDLDLEGYSRVMHGFTAVRLVQQQLSDIIEPLAEAHMKVARARRRDR